MDMGLYSFAERELRLVSVACHVLQMVAWEAEPLL